MADFLDAEAVESEDEDELTEVERKKAKRLKVESDDEEEDDDDEERMQEELQDLIDDNPIEESDGSDSDSPSKKRRRSVEDLDDRLEDDDYELIEENLGVKVQRKKKFRRLKRFEEDEDEDTDRPEEDREAIANELFEGESNDEGEHTEERRPERDEEDVDEEGDSDSVDSFIVDEEGRPLTDRKKKRKHIFSDAALQEAQDIFGVDISFSDLENFDDDYEDEEEEEDEENEFLDDETGEPRKRKVKKHSRKRPSRKTIFEIYEPSELKRGHFTDLDNQIRNNDIPERMQLREVPVTPVPENSNELDEEAEWIYRQAFCKPTVSTQDCKGGQDPRSITKKGNATTGKIKKALDFIRNQHFEVPFIAFYRKEYVLPELNVNDLWKVYKYDAKWCELKRRKEALLELFENMRQFQLEEFMQDINAALPEDVRLLSDEDISALKGVQTPEELNDVHMHFLLYYSHLIPKMKEKKRQKEREERAAARKQARRKRANVEDDEESVIENGEEPEEIEEEPEIEEPEVDVMKPAARGGPYAICRRAKLDGFAKRFGLKPEEFAENFRDNYQRHDIEQEQVSPSELAAEYCSRFLATPADVLRATKFMVATQLSREPLVRKVLRDAFLERGKINVQPTQKGLKEIDENHSCYKEKYLKEKPVREMVGLDFLKLHIAEEDKLVTITFDDDIDGVTTASYLDEMKSLYTKDEYSSVAQDWNTLRLECVDLAYRKMLLPDIIKDLRSQLLAEAKECVLKLCCQKLYNWLKTAPYSVDFDDEDDDDWDSSRGIRVMSIAYVPDFDQAPFACIVAPDGECIEYKKLPYLLRRKNSFREDERLMKEKDLGEVRDLIYKKKPHVICVGAESREAMMVVEDLKEIVKNLVEDEQFPLIPVEILDNDLSKIYANSIKGTNDFRDYPELLRQAISLARRLQDPLVEFSQLCNTDDEILCLRYHSLQEYIAQEDLMEAITREFVNRTNEVGVDINEVVQNPYSGNLLQYVCGLGPRKATSLIKMLKQTNQRLENRTQLVTMCHMGPKIFINCAGFIKIDTNALGDSTEAYVEVLDGSRVHPETYEWARKMAVDALEYEDEESNNPASALEEILESPDRLKDLDLDAFAEELERQGFGNKSITLYDIRAELNHRYKDQRTPFAPPTEEELFDLLTKETPESFYNGKMVQARVIGISRRKPKTEQLDQANPVRKDETGLWQCPFCLKSDFPELSEVWNHFDAGGCPGQAVGIRVRLDNGVMGYIHLKNLSDKHVNDPEERVRIGQVIHCRIIKIDPEKFSIEATSKATDLNDANNKWRPNKDLYYDYEAEEKDTKILEMKRKMKAAQTYVKRVITHPSFKNISFKEVITLMENMDQGECIIRPSSKGSDHLTVTWKVTDNIYQHVDVLEKNKKNAFSLGQSLWIDKEEFEDLEEIISRFVYPMGSYARELLNYKYYMDTEGGRIEKAEAYIREEKKKNPSKIHYVFSASAKYPGKFLLSYLPRNNFKHEYVTVTSDGYRFRGQVFEALSGLLKWFKEHYKDPIPGTPGSNTPHSVLGNRNTPYNPQTPMLGLSHMTPIMPPHTPHMTPHMPPHTPHMMHTPHMTPHMTPRMASHTPHMTHTPHYSVTPAYNMPHPITPQFTAPADPADWAKIAEEWRSKKSNNRPAPASYSYNNNNNNNNNRPAPASYNNNNINRPEPNNRPAPAAAPAINPDLFEEW